MQTQDLKFPLVVLDELFPYEDKEGGNAIPSMAATEQAAAALDVPWQEIRWVAPDVFSIRYGSSWVATAYTKDGLRRVRFHSSDAGDFREEDASVFEDEM
jgi:hypothetical protein